MNGWQKVKIGDFLKRIKRPIELDSSKEYKLVTVKLHHKGVQLRCLKKAEKIKSKMHEVYAGDFILSGIDARNGAFGIVPEELEGAVVTNDFWYFDIDEEIIDKHFFLELTRTSWFDEICRLGSDGTTQRIRLQKDRFFNQEVSLPSVDVQKKMSKRLTNFKKKKQQLDQQSKYQEDTLMLLRQQILQDAISGKLTADWRKENPTIEPASKLLEKIKAEKEKLIAEKKIKKEKSLPEIAEDEVPFDLPEKWEWCRLGEVFSSTSGGTPTRGDSNFWSKGDINWLKSGELNDGIINFESEEKITKKGLEKSSTFLFPKETVLIAMYGATAGKLAILDIKSTTNQAICGFLKNNFVEHKFLFHFLRSARKKMVEESWGQAQPNISQTYLKSFLFPLPPLAEQKVIVAKIEKLMEQVSQLEEKIKQNKQDAEMLMQSFLAEVLKN